jgi:NAD(P)H-nitrite reductase large subunit
MSSEGDDVLVCRCGEVTRREVLYAIQRGARSVDAVKRMTRAGMGICQGRTCGRAVAQLIHEAAGVPLAQLAPGRARPPVRPVAAQAIAGAQGAAML